jgi:hypothetical protein
LANDSLARSYKNPEKNLGMFNLNQVSFVRLTYYTTKCSILRCLFAMQLMPSNPIDMVVNAINSNGGSATPVESTSRQSFVEGADGAMQPEGEAVKSSDPSSASKVT